MMNCTGWQDQIDAYVDAELPPSGLKAFRVHAETCPGCAATALEVTESKAAIRRAGRRYTASAELRARLFAAMKTEGLGQHQRLTARRERTMSRPEWWRLTSTAWPRWGFAIATLLLVVAGLFLVNRQQQSTALAELVDLHVANLASPNPVEVVSTDRHTVKPWFQGKVPFTFDLPEVQGSPFSLVGGRVTYFHQEPGAQLLFRYQRHLISVFIFRQTSELALSSSFSDQSYSFRVRTWIQGGLRYVVVGDAAPAIIHQLSDLLHAAQ